MTKLSKVLVVFITFASLAFMAFAGAVLIAGPNWSVEAEAEDLERYKFETQEAEGEKPTHTVAELYGEQRQLKSTKVLADAVIAARQDLLSKQSSEITKIDQQLPQYESKIQEIRELIGLHLPALEKREQELAQALEQLESQVEDVGNQMVLTSQEAQARRIEAIQRREDILRLTNQLELIRADLFKAEQQQKQLRDLLYRLDGKIDIAQRTRTKLLDSGAQLPDDYDPQPAAPQPDTDKDVSEESPASD